MSQQCSWPTHSWPLEGRCPYHALLGLSQAPGFAGGPDYFIIQPSAILARRYSGSGLPFMLSMETPCFLSFPSNRSACLQSRQRREISLTKTASIMWRWASPAISRMPGGSGKGRCQSRRFPPQYHSRALWHICAAVLSAPLTRYRLDPRGRGGNRPPPALFSLLPSPLCCPP